MNNRLNKKRLKLKFSHVSLLSCSLLFSINTYAQQCLAPQQLVETLFKQYILKPNPTSFQNEKKPILKKSLTESLASKIDRDNKCQAKTELVCHIDFDLLTNAQDTPENPKYLLKTLNPLQVQATITGLNYKEKIIFEFFKENNCSKINNITYQNGRNLNKILK